MVIMVMGLVLVAGYAGRADLEPLGLKASLSPEARARAAHHLDAAGIPYQTRGQELLQP